jgi:membrane-bound lytic murein transglycosylase D
MDWLSKIPPMISALAFGYGVGMAAPETTIAHMHKAVDSASLAGRPQPSYPAPVQADGRSPYGVPPAAWPAPWQQAGPYAPPHPYAGYGPNAAAWGYDPAPRPPRQGGLASIARGNEAPELARLREAGGATCKLSDARGSQLSGDRDAEPEASEDDLDDAGREALSRLQLPDFRVAISRRALKYVRFLTRTNPGRDMFESWLKRSGRYQELIQEKLREANLPEDLIWVAMIESGFDPRAKSPAGAMGLWQFMKSTGEVYGLTVDKYADLRRDPVRATKAAAHHLRDLHQRFGSWDLALAAYNMGYEQLLDAIDRTGTTDFNELARQRAIPSETANYVPKIVAAALVADNLELYGFGDVDVYKPLHAAELNVPGGVSLEVVARAAGIGMTALRNFNPHLLGKFVPPGREHTLYIPADSLSRARAALPAMMDQSDRITDADVLEPGDLVGLSGKGRDRFDSWNEQENLLSLLPKPKRKSLRSMLRDRADEERPRADIALDGVADEFAPRRSDRETVMYRVGPGESMIGIAKQFAIDIDDLARDNGLDAEDTLREGTLLRLQVKRGLLERRQRAAAKREAEGEDSGVPLELPKKKKKRKKKADDEQAG